MSPSWKAALIEGVTPFLMGLCLSILAYRGYWTRPGTNPWVREWRRGFWARLMQVFGPGLMLLGLLMSLSAMLQLMRRAPATDQPEWRRQALSDGSCSAEFPAAPEQGRGTQTFETPHKLKLEQEGGTVYYTLENTDLPEVAPSGAEQDILDQVRDKMLKGMRQKGEMVDLVSERRLSLDQTPGRAMQIVGRFRMWARFYVKGRRLYAIAEVVPLGRSGEEEPDRFLKSFRLESPDQ